MEGIRIIQVFRIDEYGIKRIHDRVRTDKTVEEFLNTYGKKTGIYQYALSFGWFLARGLKIEELPLPTPEVERLIRW